MPEQVLLTNGQLPAEGVVTFSRQGFVRGARNVVPLAVGGCAYGLVFGVLAGQHHLSPLEVLLMSGLVYAGSAQLIVLSLWNLPGAFVSIVVTTLLVNLRMLLLGVTISPWLIRISPWKAYTTLFFLADENWALAMNEFKQNSSDVAFLLGSGVVQYGAWIGSTVLGCLLGGGITDPARWGLDFAFTAVFLALLVGRWRGKIDIVPWLVAGIVAVVSAHMLPGAWYILLGAVSGSLVGMIGSTGGTHHAD